MRTGWRVQRGRRRSAQEGVSRDRERDIRGYHRRWGSSDMAARQSAVCLAGARAVLSIRLAVYISSCSRRIHEKYSQYLSVVTYCYVLLARNCQGWLAVTRGFSITASYLCRGLHTPRTACSTISPPAVRYTVFPVSRTTQERCEQPVFPPLFPFPPFPPSNHVCFTRRAFLANNYVAQSLRSETL